jgi:hypothetical protein
MQIMKNEKGFLQLGFILVFLILIVAVSYIFYLYGKGEISFSEILPKVQTSQTPQATATPQLVDDEVLIKKAVYEKTGLTEENTDVTVSKIEGNFAKGGIKEKVAVGGAYFIAAKVSGNWIVVYDGQSTPTCVQLDNFQFPISLAPQCMTTSGKVIDR